MPGEPQRAAERPGVATDLVRRLRTTMDRTEQPARAEQETARRAVDQGEQRGARQSAAGREQGVRERVGADRTSGAERTVRGLGDQVARTGNTLLKKGARGPEVEALQKALNDKGAKLDVDGKFGPKTEQAVRDFQRANGLRQDGIVGNKTRDKLKDPDAKNIEGASGPGQTDAAKMTVKEAAQFLLNSPNVSFWSGLSTGSDRKNVERLAQGLPAKNKFGQDVAVNPKMMQALVEMAKAGKIQINALTGGGHSANSQHYRGNAVDLQPGVGLSTARIREIAARYGGVKNNESHIHLTFR